LVGGASTHLPTVLVVLSVSSTTVGNLAAVAQGDMKRLFAYSSVAHAGCVLIGILSLDRAGYAGAIFCAVSLLVTKFTGFLLLVKAAADRVNLQIAQLAGLHRPSRRQAPMREGASVLTAARAGRPRARRPPHRRRLSMVS